MMNYRMDCCDEEYVPPSAWTLLPEPVLLKIFITLRPPDILNAGQACIRWNDIARDDYLWKRLFHRDFKVDPKVGLKPGKSFSCLIDSSFFHLNNKDVACLVAFKFYQIRPIVMSATTDK